MPQLTTTFPRNAKVHHQMLGNGVVERNHADGVLVNFADTNPHGVVLDAAELSRGHVVKVARERMRSRRRTLLRDERSCRRGVRGEERKRR